MSKAPEGPKTWVLPTVPCTLRYPIQRGSDDALPHKLVPTYIFLHSGAPASVGYGLYENEVVHYVVVLRLVLVVSLYYYTVLDAHVKYA